MDAMHTAPVRLSCLLQGSAPRPPRDALRPNRVFGIKGDAVHFWALSELLTSIPCFYVCTSSCRVADPSMQDGSAWALAERLSCGVPFGHRSLTHSLAAVVLNTKVQLSVVASSILGGLKIWIT